MAEDAPPADAPKAEETTKAAPKAKAPKAPKAKAAKAPKAKTAPKPKGPAAHPTYVEMVKDAILSLKERTGSSVPAIQKYIEKKYPGKLPPNFGKILSTQLKNLVAQNKLVKIKNSFKLGEELKKAPKKVVKKPAEKKPAAKKVKTTTPKKPAAAKPKTATKPKTAAKPKTASKPKAATKPKTASKPKTPTKAKAATKPKATSKAKTAAKPKTSKAKAAKAS